MAERPKRSEDKIAPKEKKMEKVKLPDGSGASSSTPSTDSEEKPTRETKKKSTSKKSKKNEDKPEESKTEPIDCPVCLGTAVFPTRIPCGHIFCFLCVKGAARQRNKCPLCRQEIPVDFDKNPAVLEREEIESFEDGFQWFYEGKNGWWQYEKRTSEEIEQNYKLNNTKFDLLICGNIYTIDLNRNIQYDRANPNKRRRVKRENASNIAVKGVAGVH